MAQMAKPDANLFPGVMRRWLRNPQFRQRLGWKASQKVRKWFSTEQMVKQKFRVYQGLQATLGAKSASAPSSQAGRSAYGKIALRQFFLPPNSSYPRW